MRSADTARKPATGGAPVQADTERGLPMNLDVERYTLGWLLRNSDRLREVSLKETDFVLKKHRTIFARMKDMVDRSEECDRITLADVLQRHGELQAVDGLSYLLALDDGMPDLASIDGYVRVLHQKATLRRVARFGEHFRNLALQGEMEPSEIVGKAEDGLKRIALLHEPDGPELVGAGDFIRGYKGGFNAFIRPAERDAGLKSGFTRFDEMTGGFKAGELVILAARPSMGKSALALNIAWNVATRYSDMAVAFFSQEMRTEDLLLRLVCSVGRIDSQRLRVGVTGRSEMEAVRNAANRIVDAPIFIDESAQLTVPDVVAKVLRLEKRIGRKVGMVVVDYLQMMAPHTREENRTQEISKISRGLKLAAKQLECAFLVLSQLSRSAETRAGDKRPQLTDLRDGGTIEQDADVVGFIFREEVYKKEREDLRGVAEWIISKQRAGPIGTVNLVFLHAQTRFENRAEDLDPDPMTGNLPYADN